MVFDFLVSQCGLFPDLPAKLLDYWLWSNTNKIAQLWAKAAHYHSCQCQCLLLRLVQEPKNRSDEKTKIILCWKLRNPNSPPRGVLKNCGQVRVQISEGNIVTLKLARRASPTINHWKTGLSLCLSQALTMVENSPLSSMIQNTQYTYIYLYASNS